MKAYKMLKQEQRAYVIEYEDHLLKELIKDQSNMMCKVKFGLVERTSLVSWLLKVCRKSNVNDKNVFFLSL